MSASELFEDDASLELNIKSENGKNIHIDKELLIDIVQDIEKLQELLIIFFQALKSWIVSKCIRKITTLPG